MLKSRQLFRELSLLFLVVSFLSLWVGGMLVLAHPSMVSVNNWPGEFSTPSVVVYRTAFVFLLCNVLAFVFHRISRKN